MKYLPKTADVAGEIIKDQTLLEMQKASEQEFELEKQQEIAKRVDAYRFVWGIHQVQLFGIAKCLTAWDELRRLTTKPEHPFLYKLWQKARGSDREGRIAAGEHIRGDPSGFLRLLGGLDAARTTETQPEKRMKLARLVEGGINQFGDVIKRTKGLRVVEKTRVAQKISYTDKASGKTRQRVVTRTETSVVAEVITKVHIWVVKRNESFDNPFAYFTARYFEGKDVYPPGARLKSA